MNNNIPRKSLTLAKSLRTKASISERRRPFNYLLGCEIYWISLLQKTANFLRKDITLIVRNHLYASLLKSISVNVKILNSSYKISTIFAFTKIVFKGRYLEMIAPMIHDNIGNSSCIVVWSYICLKYTMYNFRFNIPSSYNHGVGNSSFLCSLKSSTEISLMR